MGGGGAASLTPLVGEVGEALRAGWGVEATHTRGASPPPGGEAPPTSPARGEVKTRGPSDRRSPVAGLLVTPRRPPRTAGCLAPCASRPSAARARPRRP